MTQLVGILRGLLPYRTRSSPTDSRAFALLSLDKYYARPDETITLDASQSFSLDVDICDYAWSIDDEPFWSSGTSSTIERSFTVGAHRATVRVTDWLDETAEYTSEVIVAEDASLPELSAPVGVVAHVDSETVVLDWSASEVMAPYLMVRLNGFDLGYAESAQNSLVINDIDLTKDYEFEVAWLSEETASDWVTVSWLSELPPAEFDSPNTGVTFAEGILPCLAMLFCAWGIWLILR
jgi:hypothetical protein